MEEQYLNYSSNELQPFPSSNLEIMSMFHHMGENYGGIKASYQGLPDTEIDPVGNFMSYFNEESSELHKNQLPMIQSSSLPDNGDKNLMLPSSIGSEIIKLKIPKSEPVDDDEFQELAPPISIRHEVSSTFERYDDRSVKDSELHRNLELPNLQSLDETISSHRRHQKVTLPFTESDHLVAHQPADSLKRFRSSSDPYKLEFQNSFPILEPNPNSSSSSSWETLKKSSSRTSPSPQTIMARQKRKLISEKTSYLQKLMPWDRKMDMATMLEEAYRYIKFLQAQVSVLQSMPCQSSFITTCQTMNSTGIKNGNHLGGLEKLNRQQLLQVLMNSPVAQTLLYSQECCVYSLEQLILLKNNIRIEQMSAAGSSSSSTTTSSFISG